MDNLIVFAVIFCACIVGSWALPSGLRACRNDRECAVGQTCLQPGPSSNSAKDQKKCYDCNCNKLNQCYISNSNSGESERTDARVGENRNNGNTKSKEITVNGASKINIMCDCNGSTIIIGPRCERSGERIKWGNYFAR